MVGNEKMKMYCCVQNKYDHCSFVMLELSQTPRQIVIDFVVDFVRCHSGIDVKQIYSECKILKKRTISILNLKRIPM